jgi:arylsulfatase A-like enzyme
MKILLAFTAVLCSVASLYAADKPNVLFIAVDDLRPELGCYGNSIVKTPNMDRIAARGIVFNKAYCQQAVCSPSRTSIMTGLRPDVTKVWDLETHFRVAQPDCITLPQYFKANGYHTSALSKIYHAGFEDGRSWNEPHWYPKGRAVDTDPVDWTKQIVTRHDVDVTEFANEVTDGPARTGGKIPKKGPAFEVSPKAEDQLPDGATAAEAVRRLSSLKLKGQPFFLAVGFAKPHLPFVAPKKYWDIYDPNDIPVPAIDHLPEGSPEFAGHNNSELHNYPGVPKGNPLPVDFAKTLRHGYYACISYTDAQIGKVLDALDKEGLADNTIIVLWGDHGWQLGDHGLWHKHTNFELATRSPLLISVPNSKTAGRKCDAPVEFVDVYPTLTDLCGLPAPTNLDGTSLKNFINNPAAPSTDVAISQYPRKDPVSGLNVMGYSIRDSRWRAIFWRDRNGSRIIATELYDELNDPAETVSVAGAPEHKALMEMFAKYLPPVGSAAITGKTKPNVIFILADDLGIGNVSCYGSDHYKTPNIDKLASTGTRFTHAFTGALCGPSRALIMSGRYAFRNGSTNQDACMRMDMSELVLPKVFKSAGYVTSMVGKYGQLPGQPDEAGFDDYLRFNGSGVYWNKKPDKPEPYRVNGKDLELGNKEYMSDLMHDQAIGFMKQHQSKPFFLYYSLVHVHGDIQPTPDSAPDSQDLFGDNILYMDKLVGKLVDELEMLKLRENTLIVFMGDNGTGKGQNDLSTIGGRNLSGMKGSMLECGGLVPMIANWPGKTLAGKVSADLIDSTDLVATFAELAGGKLPKAKTFDGHSFAAQLRGEPGKPREWIFNQLARMWYVRDARFKLNHLGELYDMSDAPFTETLVSADNETAAAKASRAKLGAALAELTPAGGILDMGDGTGRHADKEKTKPSEKSKMKVESELTIATPPEAKDRGERFDRIDKEKAGKVTRDTYAARQSDAQAAGVRFDKWDTDNDGFLTREEYIHQGQKP